MGIPKPVDEPTESGLAVVQLTVWPVVVQPQPLPAENVAGALTLMGKVVANVKGPAAEAEPILLTLTGNVAVCPAVSRGTGPTLDTRSATPCTGPAGWVGVAITEPVMGELAVPEKVGVVPAATLAGVMGILKLVDVLAANGPLAVQLTDCPVVVQPQPLAAVKLAGALIPVGRVVANVSGPGAGPLPILLILTGSDAV